VVAPTFTLAPDVVKVATRAVKLVPKGTVTAMVLPASLIIPVAPERENAVMALVEAAGVAATSALPPPPPPLQAARNATSTAPVSRSYISLAFLRRFMTSPLAVGIGVKIFAANFLMWSVNAQCSVRQRA
jgi:hypothetical protein